MEHLGPYITLIDYLQYTLQKNKKNLCYRIVFGESRILLWYICGDFCIDFIKNLATYEIESYKMNSSRARPIRIT